MLSDLVRFDLTPPEREPDLKFRADWASMVRFVRTREKEGRLETVDTQQIGDESVMPRIAGVFETARRAATVDCEYPAV